jgi:hypothetical protein
MDQPRFVNVDPPSYDPLLLLPENKIAPEEEEIFEQEYKEWQMNTNPFNDLEQSNGLIYLVQNILEKGDYIFLNDLNKINIKINNESTGPTITPLQSFLYLGFKNKVSFFLLREDEEYKNRQRDLWKKVFTEMLLIDPLTSMDEFKTDPQGNTEIRGSFSKAWWKCMNNHETNYLESIYKLIEKEDVISKNSNPKDIILGREHRSTNAHNNFSYFNKKLVTPFQNLVTWERTNRITAELIYSYFTSKMRMDQSSHKPIVPYLYPMWRNERTIRERRITKDTFLDVHTGFNYDRKLQTFYVYNSDIPVTREDANKFAEQRHANLKLLDDTLWEKRTRDNYINNPIRYSCWQTLIDRNLKPSNEQGLGEANPCWWHNFIQFDSKIMQEIVSYSTAICVLKWYKWYFERAVNYSSESEREFQMDYSLDNYWEDMVRKDNLRQDFRYYQDVLQALRPMIEDHWESQAKFLKLKIWTLLDNAIETQWGTDWNHWPSIDTDTTTLSNFTEHILQNIPLRVVDQEKYDFSKNQ